MTTPLNTVVVGAGLAGLTCARLLHEQGHQVTVFDKARGHGGRASTHRASGVGRSDSEFAFDLGCPRITPRDSAFRSHLKRWLARGVAAPWPAADLSPESAIGECDSAVGVPGMSAVIREDARGIDVRLGTRIGAVVARPAKTLGDVRFTIFDGALRNIATARTVLIAVPIPQARALVGAAPGITAKLATLRWLPGCTAMFMFNRPVGVNLDLMEDVGEGELGLAVRESSKPGRSLGSHREAWALHATPQAARRVVEQLDGGGGSAEFAPYPGREISAGRLRAAHSLGQRMLAEFQELVGNDLAKPIYDDVHVWRSAKPEQPLGEPFLFDAERRLGVCGDFCLGDDLESAFLSGKALAERLLEDHRPLHAASSDG